jgi:phenylalanine-4-hydroxylase
VKNGDHFTQSGGLVAIHPIAEALKDEYFYFAWLLRHEAFLGFAYDPDRVFSDYVTKRGSG